MGALREKKIVVTLVSSTILGALLVGNWIFNGAIGWIWLSQPLFEQPTPEILGTEEVGQSFTADCQNLYRVDLLFATFQRQNTAKVAFHLQTDGWGNQDLVTINVNASHLDDKTYYAFRFPPLKDSAGKRFLFYVESPQAKPGNAIGIWYQPADVYEEGTAYINGSAIEGDLAFRVYCKRGVLETLETILERMAQKKTLFWGNKWFYVVVFSLYLILFGALVYAISQLPR